MPSYSPTPAPIQYPVQFSKPTSDFVELGPDSAEVQMADYNTEIIPSQIFELPLASSCPGKTFKIVNDLLHSNISILTQLTDTNNLGGTEYSTPATINCTEWISDGVNKWYLLRSYTFEVV